MAIKLENKTNVTPPGGAFPYGNIKNNSGINDGTPIDKSVYADFHQFFARMLGLSSVTPNNLPEDSVNGFQYMEAFLDMANSFREERYISTGANVLTDADIGCLVIKINPGNGTATLPKNTTLNQFKKITILNRDSGTLTISAFAGDNIQPPTASIILNYGDCVILESASINDPSTPNWTVVSIYRARRPDPIQVNLSPYVTTTSGVEQIPGAQYTVPAGAARNYKITLCGLLFITSTLASDNHGGEIKIQNQTTAIDLKKGRCSIGTNSTGAGMGASWQITVVTTYLNVAAGTILGATIQRLNANNPTLQDAIFLIEEIS